LKIPKGGYEWVVSQRIVYKILDLVKNPRNLIKDINSKRE